MLAVPHLVNVHPNADISGKLVYFLEEGDTTFGGLSAQTQHEQYQKHLGGGTDSIQHGVNTSTTTTSSFAQSGCGTGISLGGTGVAAIGASSGGFTSKALQGTATIAATSTLHARLPWLPAH